MRLNIKNTRRLQQKLSIVLETKKLNLFDYNTPNMTFTPYDVDRPAEKIKLQQEQDAKDLSELFDINNAIMHLRRLVQAANNTFGVNDLINKQCKLKEEIDIYNEFLSFRPLDLDLLHVVETKINNFDVEKTIIAGAPDKFVLNCGTNTIEVHKSAESSLRKIKLEIENIKDKCSSININQTIFIPEPIEQLAKELELI